VAFTWARRRFRGVLDGLSISYMLFDRLGVPLRAKLGLTIKEYRPVQIQLREDVKTSNDDDKTYLVRLGDTLSSIAASVYRDAGLWREVANANQIQDPRSLRPGRRLRLPPLPALVP
jgi:nucleoid-associated protein YgaU